MRAKFNIHVERRIIIIILLLCTIWIIKTILFYQLPLYYIFVTYIVTLQNNDIFFFEPLAGHKN